MTPQLTDMGRLAAYVPKRTFAPLTTRANLAVERSVVPHAYSLSTDSRQTRGQA